MRRGLRTWFRRAISAARKRWAQAARLLPAQGQQVLRHLPGQPDRADGPGPGGEEPEAPEREALRLGHARTVTMN